MKKIVNSSIIVLLSGFIFIGPAQGATIKNGVNCSKPNATLKVGSKTYRCAVNPFVKPERRTWTLSTCLAMNRLWKESKQDLEDFKLILKSPDTQTQATLNELQETITSLESSMRNEACKRGA
jgi:hypothetical protein